MTEADEAHLLSNITSLDHLSTSETTDNPSLSKESCSGFSDEFDGLPFISQYMTIDFTPQDGVDSDFVQKKCCEFWEFLNSREELRHLMVYPEKTKSDDTASMQLTLLKSEYDDKSHKNIKTALSTLEIAKEKGYIDRAFEAKLPISRCSLGLNEYPENEAIRASAKTTKKSKIKACTCRGVCKTCKQKRIDLSSSSGSPRVKDLCKKMTEWDHKHPKSMAPPGHPPTPSYCVMQRKIFN